MLPIIKYLQNVTGLEMEEIRDAIEKYRKNEWQA